MGKPSLELDFIRSIQDRQASV